MSNYKYYPNKRKNIDSLGEEREDVKEQTDLRAINSGTQQWKSAHSTDWETQTEG